MCGTVYLSKDCSMLISTNIYYSFINNQAARALFVKIFGQLVLIKTHCKGQRASINLLSLTAASCLLPNSARYSEAELVAFLDKRLDAEADAGAVCVAGVQYTCVVEDGRCCLSEEANARSEQVAWCITEEATLVTNPGRRITQSGRSWRRTIPALNNTSDTTLSMTCHSECVVLIFVVLIFVRLELICFSV